MAKQTRTRTVNATQVRACLPKAKECLAAASSELEAGRAIAATSLAIHAAINTADAVTGQRVGRRGAGQDHDQVLSLLREAGKDGAGVEKSLARLLPPKARRSTSPTRSHCP